ncbi:ABC transporter ATP-binding protein [Streptomyces mirabilis]|uniref:ABC transporter ATP-binding protein n=1 Tax=Streptomyces mirabilis TaxID=68239 RepID=UPI0036E70F31
MPEIAVHRLTQTFGSTRVLDAVDFTVLDGEFVTLLGPSGCGKTTTLMSIAGFHTPDDGTIAHGDRMLFDAAQGHNIPPHPHQLSGGQQQRVALARALAHGPSVLLLDEPFSNLDAKLRERAREWLGELQRDLGITTVFVTHDQTEALAMSDRILVMDKGRIVRAGTPEDVYRRPGSRFVAEFLGRCNFLTGTARSTGPGTGLLEAPGLTGGVPFRTDTPPAPGPVTVAIRPEALTLTAADTATAGWHAHITHTTFLGDHYLHTLQAGPHTLQAHSTHPLPTTVRVTADADAAGLVTDDGIAQDPRHDAPLTASHAV